MVLQKLYRTSMLLIAALVAMIVWDSEEVYAISTPQVTVINNMANQTAEYRITFDESLSSIQKFEIKFPPGTDISQVQQSDITVYQKGTKKNVESISVSGTTLNFDTEFNGVGDFEIIIKNIVNPEEGTYTLTVHCLAANGGSHYGGETESYPYSILNNPPTVKAGEGTQAGNATPPSRDGQTAAVPYTADVSAWFEDLDGDALTYSVVSARDEDNINVIGDVSIDANTGAIEYHPQAVQGGKQVTIVVRANDGKADSTSNVTITVNVGAVPNSAPTVKAGENTQTGNAWPPSRDGQTAAVAYTADVSAWFEDLDGDALTYSVVSATDAANTDVSGDVSIAGNTITYTPQAVQGGKQVTIVVKANDGEDDSTSNVMITVNVGAVPNSAPAVKAGEGTQAGNATPPSRDGQTAAVPYTADASAWFEDLDGDKLTYSVVSARDEDNIDVSGDVSIDANTGAIEYHPQAAQEGKQVAIVVKANDGEADSTSNVTITVNVGAVPNSAPTVVDGQEAQSGNAAPPSRDGQTAAVPYTADVSAWFGDLDPDVLTYSVKSARDADNIDVSSDVSIAGNTITYTPQAAQEGKQVAIVVKANDGEADSTSNVTITVHVGAVPNSAPAVKAGEGTQTGNARPAAPSGNPKAVSYTADVSAWFEDADPDDELTYLVVSAEDENHADVRADVTLDGSSITYTPKAAQANQEVTILIRATDGHAGSAGVTITIKVGEVPENASVVLQKIQGYAGGNADDLTIEELTHAGVVGADPANLAAYRKAIEAADEIADLDALQAIIDAVNTLEEIKGYAGGDAGNLQIEDLEKAGVVSAIADNLDKYREAIEAVAEIADLSELQAIIDNVNAQEALAKIRNAAGGDASGIGIAELEMAGVTGADPARLDTYKSVLEQTNLINDLADLQSMIDLANEIQDTIDALEQLIKQNNRNLSAVQSNLNLVTADANGTTISWVTSDPAVISVDGKVTRPGTGKPNATVMLTATVSKSGIQIDSEIVVTVMARTPSPSGPPAEQEDEATETRPVDSISIGGYEGVPQDLAKVKRIVTEDGKTIDQLEFQLDSLRPFLESEDPDDRQIAIAVGSSEDDPADEIHIVIPGASLRMLQDDGLSLKVEMEGIIVELNEETVRSLQMTDEDLVLKIVPIAEEDELQEIQGRAAEHIGNRIAMGTPYRIETNYTGQTRVEFSIAHFPLPDNPFARLKMLESVGVYAEHSDGNASLLQGKVIYNQENEPVGLEIWVDRSGTFTIAAAPVDYVEFQVGTALVISGDQVQQMDVTPCVLEDQTMIPLRYASEAMSWRVEWLPETRQVRLIGDDLTILLTIDSAEISMIKGSVEQSILLKAAVQLHEERTFVPMQFFGDVMETEVHWDETGTKITILY